MKNEDRLCKLFIGMLSIKYYPFIHEKPNTCKVEEYKITGLPLKILLPNLNY